MKEQPECKVYPDGSKEWHLHGKLHREDGPAVEWPDGTKQWFLHGKCHREDGPAYEDSDGYKDWWLHGERHREDGPAIEKADGYKDWYLHNEVVHPETLVDLWLSRGVFCYYDKQSNELRFEE